MAANGTLKEYTHEINREVHFISGHYQLEKEEKIEKGGRELIYAIGTAIVESGCCGPYGCRYAIVPGYVVHWKNRENNEGSAVSVVEPIKDEKTIKELTELLEQKEWVSQVQFW